MLGVSDEVKYDFIDFVGLLILSVLVESIRFCLEFFRFIEIIFDFLIDCRLVSLVVLLVVSGSPRM